MIIKESEIRIGNWFRHPNMWCHRNENPGGGGYFEFQWEMRDWYGLSECTMDIENLVPIELTIGSLIKFGFKEVKARGGISSAYKLDGIRIECSNSSNLYWKNKSVPYIHLLQNIYYFNTLTGEDLKLRS